MKNKIMAVTAALGAKAGVLLRRAPGKPGGTQEPARAPSVAKSDSGTGREKSCHPPYPCD